MLRPTARSSPRTTAIEAVTVDLPDLAATQALGARLAVLLRRGDLVGLEGDLGVGKSELARAVIRQLAGADVEVPSPTFTLLQTYDMPGLAVIHADLYRLGEPGELAELGLDEALERGAVLVEWPERAGDALPADRLTIRLGLGADRNARQAELIAGPSWIDRLVCLRP